MKTNVSRFLTFAFSAFALCPLPFALNKCL